MDEERDFLRLQQPKYDPKLQVNCRICDARRPVYEMNEVRNIGYVCQINNCYKVAKRRSRSVRGEVSGQRY